MNSLTSWIDLGNPRPRDRIEDFIPVVWPRGESIKLPIVSTNCDELCLEQEGLSFRQIAMRRRTRRSFGPLSREALSALMEITCRTQRVSELSSQLQLSQRPVPSGGAIHPIHVLILEPEAIAVLRYDPIDHVLTPVVSPLDVFDVRAAVFEVVDPQAGTIVLLAAEPNRTAAKYEASNSVVWRDAGVLIGALALGAESLGLAHCPLGITGEPFVSGLVQQAPLVGVGAMILGARCD